MLKKIPSNTIVWLILAVLIGLLVGLTVSGSVLKAVIIVKQITGQTIPFLAPLTILGLVAPSIARLRSNVSRVLLSVFSIAYLLSVGAVTFGTVVGYGLIPHLYTQTASEGLKGISPMLFNLEILSVISVISALVLAVMLGLSTVWVRSEETERLPEVFQNMVPKLVEQVLMPVLPFFITANFCALSYEGVIIKQSPIFLSVLLTVIICHHIWLTLLYVVAPVYSRRNSWGILKYYGPAYLTVLGTMSSAAALGMALTCAKKNKISREEVIDVTAPLFANIHLCGSILTEVFFVLTVLQILHGNMSDSTAMFVLIILLSFFAIGAPGVPGDTMLASLGLITVILGFDEAGTASLPTIFVL